MTRMRSSKAKDEQFTHGVDWQVARDSMAYPDNPSFEAYTPSYKEAFDAIVAFGDTLRSTEGLDVDAEIEAFTEELQTIFDRSE